MWTRRRFTFTVERWFHCNVFFLKGNHPPLDVSGVDVGSTEEGHFGVDVEGAGDGVGDVGRTGHVGVVKSLVFFQESGRSLPALFLLLELSDLGLVQAVEFVLEDEELS